MQGNVLLKTGKSFSPTHPNLLSQNGYIPFCTERQWAQSRYIIFEWADPGVAMSLSGISSFDAYRLSSVD